MRRSEELNWGQPKSGSTAFDTELRPSELTEVRYTVLAKPRGHPTSRAGQIPKVDAG
jgi:hypothetical protein